MGDVARDAGYVPLFKGQGISVKFQSAAVAVADTDFQTIVEVQAPAGDIGNFPVIAGKQKGGKLQGEIIIPVFGNDFFGF